MRHKLLSILGLSVLLLSIGWVTGPLRDARAAGLTQEEEPVRHVVQAGETLFRIAQRYNTSVAAIVEANGIADPNRIEVGQELIIPTGSSEDAIDQEPSTVDEQGQLATYLVVPGDGLDTVARRFGTTMATLAELNGVARPTDLPPGGELTVLDQPVWRLHRVAQGETAPGLALRYDLPLWQFLTTNQLSSSGVLLPDQRVLIPSDIPTTTLTAPIVELEVGPTPVLQGNTVEVRAKLLPGAEIQAVIGQEVLRFAREGENHYALFGVNAVAEPGTYTLALLAVDGQGDELYVTRSVEILDGGYGYEELVLPADRDALLDPVALAAERERLATIKTSFNPERYWDGLFLRPIDTELTSSFGTRRLTRSASYESRGYHEGTDFNGEVGDPVQAAAAGVVVLAEQLYIRGGAVVIDHGWGVYTGYWHLSQIDVTVGQHVAPGDPIALVGNTGLSTGSHLHWDFWVNGTNVRGLQWTEQLFP